MCDLISNSQLFYSMPSDEFKQISPNTYNFLKSSKDMETFFECVISVSNYNVFAKRGKKELGIIILHDLWGINLSYLRFIQLLSTNYYIIVPDIFKEADIYSIDTAIEAMKKVKVEELCELMNQIIESLVVEEEVESFILVGIGMGGGLVLRLIQQNIKNINAAIVFYGLPKLSQINFREIKIPIQIHHPKKSKVKGFSDPQTIQKLKNTIPENKRKFFYFQQYNAQHGFIDSEDEEFNEAERKTALKKSKAFIKEHCEDKCLLF